MRKVTVNDLRRALLNSHPVMHRDTTLARAMRQAVGNVEKRAKVRMGDATREQAASL